MENDFSTFHHEDDALDRELTSLIREMEHEEAVRGDLAIPACSRAAFTDSGQITPLGSSGVIVPYR